MTRARAHDIMLLSHRIARLIGLRVLYTVLQIDNIRSGTKWKTTWHISKETHPEK